MLEKLNTNIHGIINVHILMPSLITRELLWSMVKAYYFINIISNLFILNPFGIHSLAMEAEYIYIYIYKGKFGRENDVVELLESQ